MQQWSVKYTLFWGYPPKNSSELVSSQIVTDIHWLTILAKPFGPIYFMIKRSAPHRGRLGPPQLSPGVLQMAGIHLSEQTTDTAGPLHNRPTLHTSLPNNKDSVSTTRTHASSGTPKEPPKMFQKGSFIKLPKSLHIHVSQGLSECVHLKTTPPHRHSPCPAHEACT